MEFIKINYAQLYAQIKYLLNKPGYQYWFTQSENSRIEENNEDFIFHSPEEELVLTHIRKPERFEKVHSLKLRNWFANGRGINILTEPKPN